MVECVINKCGKVTAELEKLVVLTVAMEVKRGTNGGVSCSGRVGAEGTLSVLFGTESFGKIGMKLGEVEFVAVCVGFVMFEERIV